MSGTRKVQPPRAPNSWILFRSDFVRSKPGSQSNLSKEASKVWREMSDEEKLIYEAKAVLASKAHRQQYPDYRFNPIKSTRSRRSLAPSTTVRPSQLHYSHPSPPTQQTPQITVSQLEAALDTYRSLHQLNTPYQARETSAEELLEALAVQSNMDYNPSESESTPKKEDITVDHLMNALDAYKQMQLEQEHIDKETRRFEDMYLNPGAWQQNGGC